MAVDRFGRHLHYLRISLTDRCNLACAYCMPEDATFQPANALTQDHELLRLVGIFAALGFDRLRLTGGEPTVRRDLVELVRTIRHTPGVREVTMTTNGLLLKRLARPLAEAGLKRCNISLDTLDPGRFRAITRRGRLSDVLAGIEAAEEAGLLPIKINTVVMRGYNEEDVIELARLTLDREWHVRYIEMMPFAGLAGFQQDQVVSDAEIRARLEAHFGPLEPLHGGHLIGDARLFRLAGAKGHLGFISSVSAPFCAACTRVRLTADGWLRLCLLRDGEVDLLTPLRAGASDADLTADIRNALWLKPWGHGLADGLVPSRRAMSQIGG